MDFRPPSTPQLYYSPLCLLHWSQFVLERHILGLLHTTEKHQLRRLSVPRGISYDRSWPQYHQSFENEHVSTGHPLLADTTWIRNLGLNRRYTC